MCQTDWFGQLKFQWLSVESLSIRYEDRFGFLVLLDSSTSEGLMSLVYESIRIR